MAPVVYAELNMALLTPSSGAQSATTTNTSQAHTRPGEQQLQVYADLDLKTNDAAVANNTGYMSQANDVTERSHSDVITNNRQAIGSDKQDLSEMYAKPHKPHLKAKPQPEPAADVAAMYAMPNKPKQKAKAVFKSDDGTGGVRRVEYGGVANAIVWCTVGYHQHVTGAHAARRAAAAGVRRFGP